MAYSDLKKANLKPYINYVKINLIAGIPVTFGTQGTFISIKALSGTATDLVNLKAFQGDITILDVSGIDDFWVFNMPGFDAGAPVYFDKLQLLSPTVNATIEIYVGAGDVKIPGALAIVSVVDTVNVVAASYTPHGRTNATNNTGTAATAFTADLDMPSTVKSLVKSVYVELSITNPAAAGTITSYKFQRQVGTSTYVVDHLEPVAASLAYTGASTFTFVLTNIDLFVDSTDDPLQVYFETSSAVDYTITAIANYQSTGEA